MGISEKEDNQVILSPKDLTLTNVGMVGVQRIKANELNSFVNSQDVTDQSINF